MEGSYILLRVDPFIWRDDSLNVNEKILLNFVFSFTIENKCCDVPSDWIADRFGWTERFVDEMIQMMIMRGWLFVNKEFGGVRKMSIAIPGHLNPCLATEIAYEEINP